MPIMQRSLVQVLGKDGHAILTSALLDYISAREVLCRDGCPLLMLYPFIRERKLPSSWLLMALKELQMSGDVREERGHYKVLGRT